MVLLAVNACRASAIFSGVISSRYSCNARDRSIGCANSSYGRCPSLDLHLHPTVLDEVTLDIAVTFFLDLRLPSTISSCTPNPACSLHCGLVPSVPCMRGMAGSHAAGRSFLRNNQQGQLLLPSSFGCPTDWMRVEYFHVHTLQEHLGRSKPSPVP